MGFWDNVRGVKAPSPSSLYKTIQDTRTDIKRIETNTINIRFFRKNSAFFEPTKATLYYFTSVTIGLIDQPEKLGFFVLDDAICINKLDKSEWMDLRQDFPGTLSVPTRLKVEIDEARRQFPEIKTWYITRSINNIPVKDIVFHYEKDTKEIKEEIALIDKGLAAALSEWIDNLPTDITLSMKTIRDIVDVDIFKGLHKAKSEGNFTFFMLGGLSFSFIIFIFLIYSGRL